MKITENVLRIQIRSLVIHTEPLRQKSSCTVEVGRYHWTGKTTDLMDLIREGLRARNGSRSCEQLSMGANERGPFVWVSIRGTLHDRETTVVDRKDLEAALELIEQNR